MVQTAPRTDPSAPARRASRGDWFIVGVGAVMSAGAYWDGWWHLNGRAESLFSPPHLVIYAGFAAAAGYFGYEDIRRRGRGLHRVDRLGLLGLVLFFASSIGDIAWHMLFGFEGGLELLLSPAHVGLLSSGALIFTTPLRSALRDLDEYAPSFRRFLPVLASVTIATLAVSFISLYISAFNLPGLVEHSNAAIQFLHYIQGITSLLLTNAMLLVPTLLVLQRWRPPPGCFVIMYTVVAVGIVAVQSFRWQRLALAAIVGGLTADALIWFARRRSPHVRARLVAAIAPLAMWGTWALAAHSIHGIDWSADMLGGILVLPSITGLVLSVLAFPSRPVRAREDARAP